MLSLIFLGAVSLFVVAYIVYGRFLDKRFDVDNNRPTPSHAFYDGIDRVPAHPAVLFGHHFSSIAGAGPIVGPIIASLAFGWGPTLIWVVLGAIFIGGVHDFSALMASIRHQGRSIAEIARGDSGGIQGQGDSGSNLKIRGFRGDSGSNLKIILKGGTEDAGMQ